MFIRPDRHNSYERWKPKDDVMVEECGVFGIFMDDLKAICQQGKQFSDVRFQLTVFSDIL